MDFGQLSTYGAFVGGIWALSVLSLSSVRKSEEADSRTKDAAAVAILAVNIIGSGAAAFAAGYTIGEALGGWLSLFIFLIPWLLAIFHYHRSDKGSKPASSKDPIKKENTMDLALRVALAALETAETAKAHAALCSLQTQDGAAAKPEPQAKQEISFATIGQPPPSRRIESDTDRAGRQHATTTAELPSPTPRS